MHSLLKRQVRKRLPDRLKDDPEMMDFLESINQSYEDYDDKLIMLQRATTISSKELSEVNKELHLKAERQKSVINSLNEALMSLNINLGIDKGENENLFKNFNAENLAEQIKNLAIEIIDINTEKTKLLEDLEARNHSLSNYIQIVSHDLKSPLRNINTLMSWILEEEKEDFSPESKRNYILVTQNLAKMEKLISGVLDHATVGAAVERKSQVSIQDLLLEIQKEISIPESVTLSWSKNLPIITIEKIWLEKVFYHLLKNAVNAVKDIPEGKIDVAYLSDDEYWKFAISDNGIGIAPRFHKSIFEMFRKLENDAVAAGVGLSIVKKIVGLYHGEIDVRSNEGEGSTFIFSLKKDL